jgi:hypothetical protein
MVEVTNLREAAHVPRNLLVNRDVPPFDNPDLRRAMSLSLRRRGFCEPADIGVSTRSHAGLARREADSNSRSRVTRPRSKDGFMSPLPISGPISPWPSVNTLGKHSIT